MMSTLSVAAQHVGRAVLHILAFLSITLAQVR